MDDRKHEGHRIEALVATEMVRRGYRIVARNFRRPFGELDIIALKGRQIVVCEVRSRRTVQTDDAAETVRAVKRKKIRMTTEAYLEGCPYRYDEVRFFVVAVASGGGVTRMEFFEDAF